MNFPVIVGVSLASYVISTAEPYHSEHDAIAKKEAASQSGVGRFVECLQHHTEGWSVVSYQRQAYRSRVHKKLGLTRRHLMHVWVLMLTITALAACKSETGLFVTGNENPTFEIRRSYFDEVKVFPILTVVKLDPGNERLPPQREDDSKNTILWRVVAHPTVTDKTPSANLERVEYGKVPQGFTQEFPEGGGPQPLIEGQTYEAVGPLSLMRNAAVRFRIVNGKVVVVKMPE